MTPIQVNGDATEQIQALQKRLAEAEAVIDALQSGEVDAIVVARPTEQVRLFEEVTPAGQEEAGRIVGVIGIFSRTSIQAVGRWLAGSVIAIGVLALLGWLLDLSILKRVFPGMVAMRANTAVALVTFGIGCWIANQEESRKRQRLVILAGGLPGLVGLLTLIEYIAAIDLGIDELLFRDRGIVEGGLPPGRMAPLTAIDLVLFGAALMCVGGRWNRAALVLALLTAFGAILSLLGYGYGVAELYGGGLSKPLAVHTALALLLLPASLICSQPNEGLLAILLADDAGGMMARRFFPVISLLLIGLGYLELLGQQAGLFDAEMGNSLRVLAAVIITGGLVFWNASSLNTLDRVRADAETALKEANAALERRIQQRTESLEGTARELSRLNTRLRGEIAERKRSEQAKRHLATIVEASPDAIVSIDLDDRIISWNRGAERLYGYHAEEVIGKPMELLAPAERSGEPGSLLKTILADREVRHHRTVRQSKNGEIRNVSISLYPLKNSDGETIAAASIARDIGEQIKNEETIRRANAYHRSLIEASLDPLVTVGADGKITDVNAATELVTGLDRDALIGTDFCDYFTDPDKARAGYQQVFREGQVRDYPLEVRHRDGRLTSVLYNASVYRDEAGKTLGAFAAARDITGQKRMEASLRQSEERYHCLVTATTQIVWNVDGDGMVRDVPGWRAFTGQTPEQVRGDGWSQALHPDDRAGALEAWTRARKESGYLNAEYRLRRHDGEYRHMVVHGVPIFNPDGTIREWIGTCNDVTERKQAETQVLAERQRLIDILNVIPVSLCLLTPDYHIPFANKSFVNTFGAANGRRCYEALFHQDTPCPWCQSFKPLATGKPHRWPFTGPDGRIYDVHDFPFTDVDGSQLILEVELDITEQEKARELLEQRVRERTAQLEASNQELDAFAYSVSHDLRAPLRSIDGFSQAVFEDYHDRLDAQGRDYLQRVRAATQRMGSLIDDILKLSRTTRGEMKSRQVDLGALAQSIVKELRESEPNRNVEVFIADELPGYGDPQLLSVMLQNLLGNAWKFTSKCAQPRIEFGMTSHEGKPAYFVRDNGTGFDMAYVDKLFGAFQRLHAASEFPGSGIGLATVKRIIHRHGGRVWAEGAVGKGATFYFTLGS